jgi:hypothetical protein
VWQDSVEPPWNHESLRKIISIDIRKFEFENSLLHKLDNSALTA